jgi:hypothetical protein
MKFLVNCGEVFPGFVSAWRTLFSAENTDCRWTCENLIDLLLVRGSAMHFCLKGSDGEGFDFEESWECLNGCVLAKQKLNDVPLDCEWNKYEIGEKARF